ncbi:Zn(II)2Cys6 transcription factor [Phanerochaete sordida]|uniref:Zn(II)2Cys6 transcription factor n=1 Tax=Phanerochaete sordida TaxID=48140 RepID=A0A9P3G9D4_9APHY|nr:Zn(II)2Cys6 transcription factor [Phanerochaete sordida]
MDSHDEGNREQGGEQGGEQAMPKRRRARACDQCRRRKVRCDKPEEGDERCSTCLAFDDSCTFSPTKRRNADDEYIQHLESEVVRLQFLVQQLQAQLEEKSRGPYTRPHTPPATDTSVKEEDDEEGSVLEGFRFMTLNDLRHVHYMGRSSYIGIINTAISMKREVVEASDSQVPGVHVNEGPMMLSRLRPQFWMHLSDLMTPDPPYTDFPEPALMRELLNTYFTAIHTTFPLLHGPTFLQGVTTGLHLTDEGFGAVLLLVCALGARFANNPASLPSGVTSWQLEGWRWFNQVRITRKLISMTKTSLYDLQVIVLAAAYVASLGLPYTNYALVGFGLRLAQDLGAHRRTTYETPPTPDDELKRRAFWCLIAMDRAMCTILGRPCSMRDEDFDLDFPTECDDEFWVTENPEKAFKQPPGSFSTVSHFVWYLKLMRINARALQDIYSLQGSKILQNPERAQQVIADLDSELNSWVDSLPEFLRYDSSREDLPFAAQAASLQAAYLNLRIFVHRPFITMTRKVHVPFPSFAICTNAARSCIQVLDRYFTLFGPVLLYHYHIGSLFQSGIILLLHVWQGMRTGAASDMTQEFELIGRALRALKSLELHWDIAGRLWDILHDLLTAVEVRRGNTGHGASANRGDITSPASSFPSSPAQAQQHAVHIYTAQSAPASHYGTAPAGAMDDTRASFLREPTFPPGVWQGATPELTPSVPEYDAMQTSDPDLDAIFADYLPSALPYNGMFPEAVEQFFAPGQHPNDTSTGPGAAQSYGGFDPGWSASFARGPS